MSDAAWITNYCATTEEREAVIAARNFCRANHLRGFPALDTLADRWKEHLTVTAKGPAKTAANPVANQLHTGND